MKTRHKRIMIAVGALAVLGTATALVLNAFNSNLVFFYSPTQVAAKVGSSEISVHQINQVLSRTNTNGANAAQVQAMSREVLEKLIDQQLAVDQATENKLNRSPDVVSQIEAARRDILARAYIQQISAGVAKPSPEDIKNYYTSNPQLFSERRIFNVQEIVAPNAPGVAATLKELVAAGKSAEDMAAALKAKNIQFNGGGATRAARGPTRAPVRAPGRPAGSGLRRRHARRGAGAG